MPALAAAQVQVETRRRDEAVAAMEGLRRRLHRLAIAVGLAAPLVLGGLYLWVFRPLFARLASATAAADALAAGAPAPGRGGHDELGLLLARVRRVASRVARDRGAAEPDGGGADRGAQRAPTRGWRAPTPSGDGSSPTSATSSGRR